ncbi:unnamed protein product [Caenorhabditis auriculariae]|uniref:G-protein coupled receptors family 1 profile domain-containing protein n=1 Tax=Caenorhabditis auriculariae TaxID=2777116 RepID=A0A8S1H5B2_9PELO|nr:unnamed protein product [Caenorhabditis auriculariae]
MMEAKRAIVAVITIFLAIGGPYAWSNELRRRLQRPPLEPHNSAACDRTCDARMKVQVDTILVISVYSALAITGLFGNVWVLMTVWSQLLGCGNTRGKPYKSVVQNSAYIYLLLLSIVDLITLISVPIIVSDIYANRFPFGIALCKLMFFCEGINKTLSPMVLTALSVDRFIAVCHPTLHWMRQTLFSTLVIVVCFLFSLVFIIPIISNAAISTMSDQNMHQVNKCALVSPFLFDLMHTVVCYLMPLTAICGVYLAILRKLFIHTRFSTVGQKTSISLSRVVKCSVMVVAFYFICWTPYWTARTYYLLTPDRHQIEIEEPEQPGIFDSTIFITIRGIKFEFDGRIFIMYMLHALPYSQSAFNWLFYAFLNRNLRNSTLRCTNGTRSAGTSTIMENGGGVTVSTGFTPIWKNIQQMGTQIKSAGIDTGNALLKMSPFRGRSRIQSRSSTCLEYSNHLSLPPQASLSTSLLDIPRRPSLVPRQEPSLVGKALSFNNLPQYHVIDQKEDTSPSVSESSSVEWL